MGHVQRRARFRLMGLLLGTPDSMTTPQLSQAAKRSGNACVSLTQGELASVSLTQPNRGSLRPLPHPSGSLSQISLDRK